MSKGQVKSYIERNTYMGYWLLRNPVDLKYRVFSPSERWLGTFDSNRKARAYVRERSKVWPISRWDADKKDWKD